MELITTATTNVALLMLLGRTAKTIGNDINQLYEIGRDKIIAKAIKKTKNLEETGQTNLRVTRDVFWNGSFTDEEICAEYFGGIWAASRSEDGKDDSGIFYLDIIKSLSSAQLKMHYFIYRSLNKKFLASKVNRNKNFHPESKSDVEREGLLFQVIDPIEEFGNEDTDALLYGLQSKSLIGDFKVERFLVGEKKIVGVAALTLSPTSLGIQLFAIANNKFSDWKNFSTVDFGDFDDVILPLHFNQSPDEFSELIRKTELKREKE